MFPEFVFLKNSLDFQKHIAFRNIYYLYIKIKSTRKGRKESSRVMQTETNEPNCVSNE